MYRYINKTYNNTQNIVNHQSNKNWWKFIKILYIYIYIYIYIWITIKLITKYIIKKISI